MLRQFFRATLVEEPPRLGGAPFRLYIVDPRPISTPAPASFTQGLQLLAPTAQPILGGSTNEQWLTTRWRITDNQPAAPRTGTTFHFNWRRQDARGASYFSCWLSSTRANDQLLTFVQSSQKSPLPAALTFAGSRGLTQPVHYQFGPLTLVTFDTEDVNTRSLQTANGKLQITVPVSRQ
jgi:hypothetical protein